MSKKKKNCIILDSPIKQTLNSNSLALLITKKKKNKIIALYLQIPYFAG
jgi:hypothetical protein